MVFRHRANDYNQAVIVKKENKKEKGAYMEQQENTDQTKKGRSHKWLWGIAEWHDLYHWCDQRRVDGHRYVRH